MSMFSVSVYIQSFMCSCGHLLKKMCAQYIYTQTYTQALTDRLIEAPERRCACALYHAHVNPQVCILCCILRSIEKTAKPPAIARSLVNHATQQPAIARSFVNNATQKHKHCLKLSATAQRWATNTNQLTIIHACTFACTSKFIRKCVHCARTTGSH